jgi:hypothetical protein
MSAALPQELLAADERVQVENKRHLVHGDLTPEELITLASDDNQQHDWCDEARV